MLDFSEISVIVQGAISKEYTPKCLSSIRCNMPGAEIILSVAEGSDCSELDYDKLILTQDPGAFLIDKKNNVYNNVNRQIVSTVAGLKSTSRQYALKFRTDLELISTEWLQYFKRYDGVSAATKFENRVIVCNYYTRNPRVFPVPYHLSDWIMFGNRNDLLKYFDVKLLDEKEALWFKSNPKKSLCFEQMLSRYVPEQYFCINFLKQFDAISCETYYDNNIKNIESTERFFAENTIILDYQTQLAIEFKKYNPNRYFDSPTLISYNDWRILYNKYCKNNIDHSWKRYLSKCMIKRIILFQWRRQIITILSKLHLKGFFQHFLRNRKCIFIKR